MLYAVSPIISYAFRRMGNTSKVDVDCVHYGYVGDGEMVFWTLSHESATSRHAVWGELQEHLETRRPPSITEPYGDLSSDVEKIAEAFDHNDHVLIQLYRNHPPAC